MIVLSMAPAETDLDGLLDDRPIHGGEYGLWLRVTTLAVIHLLDGRFSGQAERDFLFDENNDFFIAVCEQLGFTPEAFRERIREAVKRSAKDRRGLMARSD